jgi:hypothetical protein
MLAVPVFVQGLQAWVYAHPARCISALLAALAGTGGVGDDYLASGAPRLCGSGEVVCILARAPGCGRQ